jgi:hypothetical protein
VPKTVIYEIKEVLDKKEYIKDIDREKLKSLLTELESEIKYLESARIDEAKSLLQIAYMVIEDIENNRNEYGNLENAALEFEVDHPKVTYLVQSICQILSNIGI